MPKTVDSAPAAHWQALITFLHGIEPRAWVFVLSQCGDAQIAQAALESGLRDFIARSKALRLAQWPLQFWASLLRQPQMLASLPRQDELATFSPGPRAALLLRLIAGLDFSHAAEVLGVTPEAYEVALRNALDNRHMDDARMQALREDLQAQVHQMPESRKRELAQLRAAAMAALLDDRDTHGLAHVPRAASLPPRAWLWAGAGVLLLVLMASFVWPGASRLRPGQHEALPADRVGPAPELTDELAIVHPDYLLLAHPALEPLARRVALLSWIAAAASPASPPTADLVPAPLAWQDLGSEERRLLGSARQAWAALDDASRHALVEQARDWQSRPAPSREQLRRRLQQWDQLDAKDRARRRSRLASWQELSVADQRRVRAAAAHLDSLPANPQEELARQFAALPADAQRLWALGPDLGQQLAPIAALFAFLPKDERPTLLAALRQLDAQARADLALLAPRLDEKQRQDLRRQLLAADPARRPALIRQRLAQ